MSQYEWIRTCFTFIHHKHDSGDDEPPRIGQDDDAQPGHKQPTGADLGKPQYGWYVKTGNKQPTHDESGRICLTV